MQVRTGSQQNVENCINLLRAIEANAFKQKSLEVNTMIALTAVEYKLIEILVKQDQDKVIVP